MQRIVIVGTTGTGKTTLAKALSKTLNIPHIELDALFWNENWIESSDELFIQRVRESIDEAGESWIVDGNYKLTRTFVWPEVDTVIWLDYPLWLIYWRLFWRSVRRIVTRELVWNKNRETFYNQFLASDNLIALAANSHKNRKATYSKIIENDTYPHIQFHHFRHPSEAEAFLRNIRSSAR